MKREAWVVADLAFGDAGKGTISDWLVRDRAARLVVRWNGGAQAGHNVVTVDGRHHTFSQLGAGTFVPGVRTHLSEEVVVHPTGLLVEARQLAGTGVRDALERLTIAESARVITPFHQAAGRLRELARGDRPHGTCGVGVGEAVRDALAHPDDAVRIGDLSGDRRRLRARLARVRERVRASTFDREVRGEAAARERAIIEDAGVIDGWLDAVAPLGPASVVVPDCRLAALLQDGPVVLEGAQGVLLDEWRGFHPHTTWTSCTAAAAHALLARHGFAGPVRTLGVLRTYLTRHGDGPLPTEDDELTAALPEPHNDASGWQGRFRVGWPDLVLARYALAVAGPVDALAITHADRLAAVDQWLAATAYEGPCGRARDLPPSPSPDLAHQERLTAQLRASRPVLEPLALGPRGAGRTERYVDWIGSALARPVWLVSAGPTAADKRAVGMSR